MTPYEQGYIAGLVKLAVSPNMAFRALRNAAEKAPERARKHGIGLLDDMIAMKGRSPRTMATAEQLMGPGGHQYQSDRLSKILTDQAENAALARNVPYSLL